MLSVLPKQFVVSTDPFAPMKLQRCFMDSSLKELFSDVTSRHRFREASTYMAVLMTTRVFVYIT